MESSGELDIVNTAEWMERYVIRGQDATSQLDAKSHGDVVRLAQKEARIRQGCKHSPLIV